MAQLSSPVLSTSIAQQFGFRTDDKTLLNLLTQFASMNVNLLAMTTSRNADQSLTVLLVPGTVQQPIVPEWNTAVSTVLERQFGGSSQGYVAAVDIGTSGRRGTYVQILSLLYGANIAVNHFYATDGMGLILECNDPAEAVRTLQGKMLQYGPI